MSSLEELTQKSIEDRYEIQFSGMVDTFFDDIVQLNFTLDEIEIAFKEAMERYIGQINE